MDVSLGDILQWSFDDLLLKLVYESWKQKDPLSLSRWVDLQDPEFWETCSSRKQTLEPLQIELFKFHNRMYYVCLRQYITVSYDFSNMYFKETSANTHTHTWYNLTCFWVVKACIHKPLHFVKTRSLLGSSHTFPEGCGCAKSGILCGREGNTVWWNKHVGPSNKTITYPTLYGKFGIPHRLKSAGWWGFCSGF